MSYEATKSWRIRNPVARANQSKRYYAQTDDTANRTREKWTAAEDRAVLAQATTDLELARLIGRTIRAVQHRRHVLRKVSLDEQIVEEL
jgi:hypothetical protein